MPAHYEMLPILITLTLATAIGLIAVRLLNQFWYRGIVPDPTSLLVGIEEKCLWDVDEIIKTLQKDFPLPSLHRYKAHVLDDLKHLAKDGFLKCEPYKNRYGTTLLFSRIKKEKKVNSKECEVGPQSTVTRKSNVVPLRPKQSPEGP